MRSLFRPAQLLQSGAWIVPALLIALSATQPNRLWWAQDMYNSTTGDKDGWMSYGLLGSCALDLLPGSYNQSCTSYQDQIALISSGRMPPVYPLAKEENGQLVLDQRTEQAGRMAFVILWCCFGLTCAAGLLIFFEEWIAPSLWHMPLLLAGAFLSVCAVTLLFPAVGLTVRFLAAADDIGLPRPSLDFAQGTAYAAVACTAGGAAISFFFHQRHVSHRTQGYEQIQ